MVNTGCWVTKLPIYNTYAILDATGLKLFIYGGKGFC